MTVATLPLPTVPATSTAPSRLGSGDERFTLSGISWADYEKLLDVVGDRRVFVTYDRRRAGIVSPLWTHNDRSDLIGVLIRSVAEGLRVPVRAAGRRRCGGPTWTAA